MTPPSTAATSTNEAMLSARSLPQRIAGTHLPRTAYRDVARVPSSTPDSPVRWRDDEEAIATLLAALRGEW